jgi:hypothetical protein
VRFKGWELSRVRRRSRTGRWATIGFMGGVAIGLVLWSFQMKRSRRDLFSPSPLKRLAAMGYLGGEATLENVQLLAEYLRWEANPMLQKRASRLMKAMQARLV